jgi:hypothetical protein
MGNVIWLIECEGETVEFAHAPTVFHDYQDAKAAADRYNKGMTAEEIEEGGYQIVRYRREG